MSEQFSFDGTPLHQKQGMSTGSKVGIGCGIAALLFVILLVVGFFYVKSKAREFGADIASSMMKSGLEEFDIPAEQLTRINTRIDSIAQRFKDGEMDLDQVGAIFEEIGESPLLSAGMALFFQRSYLNESGLSDNEKATAEIAVQRFTRGVIDKKIPEKTSQEIIDSISVKDEDGRRELRKNLTDDELRTFVEAITTAADEAGIPEEVLEINFADEFDKAVDQAMSGM